MNSQAAAQRLKSAREKAGFASAAEAARALGVHIVTYTSHENGTRGFPASKAELYARRFRVDLNWLLTGKGGQPQSGHAFAEAVTLPLLGSVQAGAWQEQAMIDPQLAEQLPVPQSDRIPGARQYYLEIIGDSVNAVLPPGSKALCCDVWDWARDAEDLFRRGHNRLVVAQRERHGLFETTIKRLIVEKGKPRLHTASNSPKFRNEAPVALAETGDVNGVAIVAVVTGAQIPL